MTAVDSQLVDDDQVGKASHGVPPPFRAALNREGGKETSQDHDDVSNDGNEDVGTGQSSEKAKIQ